MVYSTNITSTESDFQIRTSWGALLHRIPWQLGDIWAAVFTFNPYLLISINGIIDINNSFIDINKYGHIIHLY